MVTGSRRSSGHNYYFLLHACAGLRINKTRTERGSSGDMAIIITSEFHIIMSAHAPARARPGKAYPYRAHARIKCTVELRGWG